MSIVIKPHSSTHIFCASELLQIFKRLPRFAPGYSVEVVQGGITVERVFAGSMNLTSGFLQTTTRLAFHGCEVSDLKEIFRYLLLKKLKLHHPASLVLDGASTANITLHLHLAVGQFAAVVLMWLQHASTRDDPCTKG